MEDNTKYTLEINKGEAEIIVLALTKLIVSIRRDGETRVAEEEALKLSSSIIAIADLT